MADIPPDLVYPGAVEEAIQKSNATAIAPPDLVCPDAVELDLDIRREYAKKLVESYERARNLQADLAGEEHRGQELVRILKEVFPYPMAPNVDQSCPARKVMARLYSTRRKRLIVMLIIYMELLNNFTLFLMNVWQLLFDDHLRSGTVSRVTWDYYSSAMVRDLNFQRPIYFSDAACIENIRMDRRSFHKLCELVKTIGMLVPTNHMGVEEQVAIFLHILSHDVKNSVIKRQFMSSGETISRQFTKVLHAVLKCQTVLLKQPKPVPANSTDERWKWFENCLGALDGTYIKLNVLQADKARHRTRKGEIATNVLGVCSQDLQFIYVLAGWEGSASDSRVLSDAISRMNGLKVPKGYYYLCDAGYMNGEGFLAPYRGQRYHLSEWRQGAQPATPKEFFNMKHSSARNVIEQCFGLLKGRWGILSTKSFYPIKTQVRIINACCLLHNHVRREMKVDPLEHHLMDMEENEDILHGERITHVETSDYWSIWRDELAAEMFNRWRRQH